MSDASVLSRYGTGKVSPIPTPATTPQAERDASEAAGNAPSSRVKVGQQLLGLEFLWHDGNAAVLEYACHMWSRSLDPGGKTIRMTCTGGLRIYLHGRNLKLLLPRLNAHIERVVREIPARSDFVTPGDEDKTFTVHTIEWVEPGDEE